MDRDIVYGLAISTIFLTLIGGWYLTPSKPRAAGTAVAEVQSEGDAALEPGASRYTPEDVRYKFEQRAKKQGKRKPANPVVEDAAPTPVDSENEAPPIDDGGDETAEEPPIE
jgi:hypothetical protein